MTTSRSERFIGIMAGGSGERFWPMSRRETPKHLLKLLSEETLLEATARRALEVVPPSHLFILTNEVQRESVQKVLPFLPPSQIIAEPARRDTAPAAALATAWVHSRSPGAGLALLPADAWITQHEIFARQLKAGFAWAETNPGFLTYAVRPHHPATGYGYLEMTQALETDSDTVVEVKRFVEKPDLEKARQYVADGRHGWNAGIFLWRTDYFLEETRRLEPALADFIVQFPAKDWQHYLETVFPTLPKISVDYAIMEKAARVVAITAAFDWDDVGSWTALPAHLPQDASGNAIRGQVIAHAAANNIVIGNGRVVALCGVSDLIVVETPDAVLVCHRDHAQDIKKLLPALPPSLT